MSRILVLLIFGFWLSWTADCCHAPVAGVLPSLGIFLGGYALLVLGTRWWCLRLCRLNSPNLYRRLNRFNRVMFAARVFIPLWFIAGIGLLGWWQAVARGFVTPSSDWMQSLPGVIVGTLPAFAAWAGLWWSQYPAEFAFREQSLLSQLELDLPVHRPPDFAGYFAANLRLQLLFMIVPVLLIVALHDLIRLAGSFAIADRWGLGDADNPFTWLASAVIVFAFASEILRRVLPTERLGSSPLRRRLESLCRRTGVKYRDILLWKTQSSIGNAAVMGFLPRWRYILLSDLLLETMTDEQIEAVFAHELGHIVHRHMVWLTVFIFVLMLLDVGGGEWAARWMASIGVSSPVIQGVVIGAAYLFKFVLLFGFVSRRFERQADVFAARTMEASRAAVPDVAASEMLLAARRLAGASPAVASSRSGGHVGQYGAAVFGSALQRVALVNNIPIKAASWCHGSIARRMNYLHELSADPRRTRRFDRVMLMLYGAMVFALFAGAAFCRASNALP